MEYSKKFLRKSRKIGDTFPYSSRFGMTLANAAMFQIMGSIVLRNVAWNATEIVGVAVETRATY